MNYKLTTLENGLRVVVVPLPSLESATLTVWVGVGSRYEEPKISGLSHFLEHMVFKGGKKYSSAKEVSEKIDTMGAENNAGTAHEWTNFYIKARAGLIGEAFDVLSDVVLRPILKTEDINRERGVILEEIAMEEDTPVEKIGDVFGELIFSGSSLGVNIAGSPQTVSHIHKSDFVRYRNTHYDAKNIVITVAGGVDVIKTVKLAEKYFGTLSGTKRENAEQFISKQTAPRLKVEYKKSESGLMLEPWVKTEVVLPDEYLGRVIELMESRRGIQKNIRHLESKVIVEYEMPLSEVIIDFYDQIKSATSGYGSVSYEIVGYRESDLVELDFFIAAEKIEAFSRMVYRGFAQHTARRVAEKMKEFIPRQNFEVKIQAMVGGRILASERIAPFRKDVTEKLYGGDVTRKKKLLEKQKKGKRKLAQIGKVTVPTDVFIKLLKY